MSTLAEHEGETFEAHEERLLGQARNIRRKEMVKRTVDRTLLTMALLGLWELAVHFHWIHQFFLSKPSLIAGDLYQMISTGYIFPHLAITMYEALAGMALGVVFGVATGFAAALSTRVADALLPIIVAFNSMPRVAIAPLFIIWFGFGPPSKIALAALVVYFAIFFNTFSGMRSVEPVLMNSIRIMGASKIQVLWLVNLPHTMAWVFAAMNTSISLALIGAVVGEFIGSTGGIGWIMVQATGTLDTTRLFSTMIILAIVGAALFTGLQLVEDRVLRWRPHQET